MSVCTSGRGALRRRRRPRAARRRPPVTPTINETLITFQLGNELIEPVAVLLQIYVHLQLFSIILVSSTELYSCD